MDYITIGQWSLPIHWLAFIVSIFYMDFRLKKKNIEIANHLDRLTAIYLIVWKGSYIAFQFDSFRNAPLSLLYFDGGLAGHITALIALLLYIWWKKLRDQELIMLLARFMAAYNVVLYLFSEQWLLVIIWGIILVLIELKYLYWIFVFQWLLILIVEGWQSYFIYTMAIVVFIDIIASKRAQVLAAIFIASLISTMFSTFPVDMRSLERKSINLEMTTGSQYRLEEQKESVVVVNFFATWCPPCNAEMPHLQKFSDNLPQDVQLIGINLSARDNGESALQVFMNKHQVEYPILLDINDDYGKSYGIKAIPTTVILKNGDEV